MVNQGLIESLMGIVTSMGLLTPKKEPLAARLLESFQLIFRKYRFEDQTSSNEYFFTFTEHGGIDFLSDCFTNASNKPVTDLAQ